MAERERSDPRRNLTGEVTAFDAATGLGTVCGDGGEFRFHCIEIADGTRDIAIGARVTFDLIPKFGRWEAATVRT
ncbi:MAG: hypothetical protein AAGG08_04580 [Actinomycetota bacterium]